MAPSPVQVRRQLAPLNFTHKRWYSLEEYLGPTYDSGVCAWNETRQHRRLERDRGRRQLSQLAASLSFLSL